MNIAVDECGDHKDVIKYREIWNEICAEVVSALKCLPHIWT